MTALYTSGTISLVNGSDVITGIDTAWETALIVGGTVHVEAEGNPLPILPDDSAGDNEHPITDTQMTAAIKWLGATGTYKYALVRENTYTSAQAANADKIAELLRRLNHPTIAAIAGVQGEQDHLILLTGASTATIIPRTSLIQGIEADATVETPAGLATYDGEAAGFIVLVSNAGNQRAALYFKVSAAAGDWSDPAYLTGEKGDKGDTGADGVTDKGTYVSTNVYAARDVVLDNGSTWLARIAVPSGNPPPVLPTTQNDHWRLLARRGIDGTGTGDVVGPATPVVAGNIAQFTTTEGRNLGRATIGSPALLGRLSPGAGDVERLTAAQARQVLGGWEFIGSFALAGLTVLTVTGLGAYKSIKISGTCYLGASDGVLLQFSGDNGSSYGADADEFRYTILDGQYTLSSGALATVPRDANNSAIPVFSNGGDASWPAVCEYTVHNFGVGLRSALIGNAGMSTGPDRYIRNAVLWHKRAAVQNAMRFFNGGGAAFSYGFIHLEGVR